MKGNWENEKAKLRIDPSFSSETFFLWSAILLLLHFFFSPLFSFSNKLPIAIEIPDESHRLILSFYICVSRSTLLSSKTLPVSKQSSMQTQGNEVMHLELCNFVLIETKLRCKYILSSDYIRIRGNRPLK